MLMNFLPPAQRVLWHFIICISQVETSPGMGDKLFSANDKLGQASKTQS